MRYLGRQLAALEGAAASYCCASGMAAISATLLALCNSGDHIVCSNAVYGGTFALCKVRHVHLAHNTANATSPVHTRSTDA